MNYVISTEKVTSLVRKNRMDQPDPLPLQLEDIEKRMALLQDSMITEHEALKALPKASSERRKLLRNINMEFREYKHLNKCAKLSRNIAEKVSKLPSESIPDDAELLVNDPAIRRKLEELQLEVAQEGTGSEAIHPLDDVAHPSPDQYPRESCPGPAFEPVKDSPRDTATASLRHPQVTPAKCHVESHPDTPLSPAPAQEPEASESLVLTRPENLVNTTPTLASTLTNTIHVQRPSSLAQKPPAEHSLPLPDVMYPNTESLSLDLHSSDCRNSSNISTLEATRAAKALVPPSKGSLSLCPDTAYPVFAFEDDPSDHTPALCVPDSSDLTTTWPSPDSVPRPQCMRSSTAKPAEDTIPPMYSTLASSHGSTLPTRARSWNPTNFHSKALPQQCPKLEKLGLCTSAKDLASSYDRISASAKSMEKRIVLTLQSLLVIRKDADDLITKHFAGLSQDMLAAHLFGK